MHAGRRRAAAVRVVADSKRDRRDGRADRNLVGAAAEQVVEAVIFGVDHHDVLDLIDVRADAALDQRAAAKCNRAEDGNDERDGTQARQRWRCCQLATPIAPRP